MAPRALPKLPWLAGVAEPVVTFVRVADKS